MSNMETALEWYGNIWKNREPEFYAEYQAMFYEKDDACKEILP